MSARVTCLGGGPEPHCSPNSLLAHLGGLPRSHDSALPSWAGVKSGWGRMRGRWGLESTERRTFLGWTLQSRTRAEVGEWGLRGRRKAAPRNVTGSPPTSELWTSQL